MQKPSWEHWRVFGLTVGLGVGLIIAAPAISRIMFWLTDVLYRHNEPEAAQALPGLMLKAAIGGAVILVVVIIILHQFFHRRRPPGQ